MKQCAKAFLKVAKAQIKESLQELGLSL